MIIQSLTRLQSNELYRGVIEDGDDATARELCLKDLFFLLSVVCKRPDVNRDWLYDRVREVEAQPNGMLDLWGREMFKSTIITYALTIQDILKNPEITVGIFSHTRPIAKAFLSQIKTELQDNATLKGLFPEILYQTPTSEAPKWSLDNGICVKRKTNPKEQTVEAWGLVDGMPTSKHYQLMVYDDVVTRESVTTPEMIKKVTEAWELSTALSTEGGIKRYIGTRYRFGDTWQAIMDRKAAVPRIHPATHNGKIDGKPVLFSVEYNDQKRKEMGLYTYGCQMLQDPKADSSQGFDEAWLKYWNPKNTAGMNIYIVVDPANAKKKRSDYTAMWVIGLAPDLNYMCIDVVRDKLNLTERTQKLMDLHRKYRPLGVGYEQYGKDSDIAHIEYVQNRENYRFKILPLGGTMSKEDRIRQMVPLYEQGRVFLPNQVNYRDFEGRHVDLIQDFKNDEYLSFPVAVHDDMFDCQARIVDPTLNAQFPIQNSKPRPVFASYGSRMP